MRELKKILLFLLLFLFIFMEGATFLPSQQPILRLHVRAHSNSPRDQAVKFMVRDQVLLFLAEYVQEAEDVQEVQRNIAQKLPEIVAVAAVVEQAGLNYQVAASLGPAMFPPVREQVWPVGMSFADLSWQRCRAKLVVCPLPPLCFGGAG